MAVHLSFWFLQIVWHDDGLPSIGLKGIICEYVHKALIVNMLLRPLRYLLRYPLRHLLRHVLHYFASCLFLHDIKTRGW